MYKVFLNDRIIRIVAGENITIKQPSVIFSEKVSEKELYKWFLAFEVSGMSEISLEHPNHEWFFNQFQKAFTVIYASGGVVLSQDKLLVIFRHGKWDLPKGKFEKHESAEEAAMREVEEETGIRPNSIDHRLPSTFHIYKSNYPDTHGQWIFKETIWFQMNYEGVLSGKPQQEEGISQVKWISRKNLDAVIGNTYENLKQVLNLYRD